jgi:hypothetical protein
MNLAYKRVAGWLIAKQDHNSVCKFDSHDYQPTIWDKTYKDCSEKFNNTGQFRGFPSVPTEIELFV